MRAALHSARFWGPLVLGFACLVASTVAGAVVGWLLVIASFALLLDGTTAMWERAGGTGNLTTHKQ